MVDPTALSSILEDRRRLEDLLAKDPTNLEAHQLVTRLRSFLAPDPDFNQALKELEMSDNALVLLSVPEFLEIESTTRCNINPPCIMCHTRMFRSSDRDIDSVVLDRIKPYTCSAKSISLHGGGEPLIVPNLFDIVESIEPKRTSVRFSSNGLLLTADRCDEIISRGVGYIDFSLDAARAETYDRIRHSDFERVVDNLKRLAATKRARQTLLPEFCLSMVIMKENIREAVEFVELADRVGARCVEFMKLGPLSDQQYYQATYKDFLFDYEEQMLEKSPEVHDEWMCLAYRRAEALGLTFRYEGCLSEEANMYLSDRPQDLSPRACGVDVPKTMPILCKKPWVGFLVLMNGNAFFCCHMPSQVLGNLRRQGFDEVWNGERAQAIRKIMLEDPLPMICKDCHTYKARQQDPALKDFLGEVESHETLHAPRM
jgi:radical SAM protein with 4Fe4S-binding SPASM domain